MIDLDKWLGGAKKATLGASSVERMQVQGRRTVHVDTTAAGGKVQLPDPLDCPGSRPGWGWFLVICRGPDDVSVVDHEDSLICSLGVGEAAVVSLIDKAEPRWAAQVLFWTGG